MGRTAAVRAKQAATYRQMAARARGDRARSYLARAQRLQQLARRAELFAQSEDNEAGKLDRLQS